MFLLDVDGDNVFPDVLDNGREATRDGAGTGEREKAEVKEYGPIIIRRIIWESQTAGSFTVFA
jgi:hypothetical protein